MRTKKEETAQDLLDGKVKMDEKKGLMEYIARFREKIHLTGLKDLTYVLPLFRKGLTPALQKACKANYRGSEFESLEDIITHAIGENKKLDNSSETQNSKAVLNYAANFKRFKRAQNQSATGGSWREVVNRRPTPSQTGAGPSNSSQPQNNAQAARFSGPPRPAPAAPQRPQNAARPPRNQTQNPQQKRKRQDVHLSNPNGATNYFANYLGRCLTHKEFHQHRRKGLCGRCGKIGHIGEDCTDYPYVAGESTDAMAE